MPRPQQTITLPTLAELYPPTDKIASENVHIKPVIGDANGAFQRDIEDGQLPGWEALRRAAAAQASPSGQLVLLTTDMHQMDIAINLVANLAAVGVHHYLVLGDQQSTCAHLRDKLACVWSTLMLPRFANKLRSAATNKVRAAWLVRQIYVGRLAALGFSPMLLDADVVLFHNPFTIIDKYLPGYQAYFLGDSSAGWLCVNGGTLYLRNATIGGPTIRIWRELERRVFKLINTSTPYPKQLHHRTPRGLWIGGIPADALLYDQNVLDWNIVGELTGDREYIGRGFVPEARTLTDTEKLKIVWKQVPSESPTPSVLGQPGGTYGNAYTLRSLEYNADGGDAKRERMIKVPPWLFSAESDVYKTPRHMKDRPTRFAGDRVVARYWSVTPAPTTLVHFVCTRWPGSDGRKIGMRLLKKWYAADIAWARTPPPPPPPAASAIGLATESTMATSTVSTKAMLPHPGDATPWIIGFANPIPLGDMHRIPSARCRARENGQVKVGAPPCMQRWRPMRGNSPHDRTMLEAWNRMLAVLALVTDRTAVLPLYQCVGILDSRGRYGWTLYPKVGGPGRNDYKPGAGTAGASLMARLRPVQEVPPERDRAACAFRFGEGCFSHLAFPEQLSSLQLEDKLIVDVPVEVAKAGGLGAILNHVKNASASWGGWVRGKRPKGVVINVDAMARMMNEVRERARHAHARAKQHTFSLPFTSLYHLPSLPLLFRTTLFTWYTTF